MKNNKWLKKVLPAAVVLGMSAQAGAAITLYDQDDTRFAVDGLLNTFLVSSETKTATTKTNQSRVMMGFLPNYIGFNFSKTTDGLKVGARSSFWVSINDSDRFRAAGNGRGDSLGTETGIDVRQFYATAGASWGEVLVGKDFALFSRSNILNDEMLLGYGQTSTVGADTGNVSFGNIGTGYLYPFPVSQITYRSPKTGGFQIAVGAMDPNKSSATSEESTPRLEAEATFAGEFDGGSYMAWLGGMSQSSEAAGGGSKIDSNGVSYGVNVKVAGLSLTASGFDAEGAGLAGLGHVITANTDVDGYLLQGSYSFGNERLVASYGENRGGTTLGGSELDLENSALAWFHKINDNLQLVAEYDKSETKIQEVSSIAIGAVLTY